MKAKLFFGISCISVVLVVSLIPANVSALPRIVFEQEVHNFGDVMQGENVEHTFVFENQGNEELIIEKVSPS